MASNEVTNAQPEFFYKFDNSKSYLYEELWKLCAGHLLDLPKYGEKAYYFPQGHIENLGTCTKEELAQMIPIFDIPSKLLCNVIGIQLKVENDTDEVYAQITLVPEIDVKIHVHNDNHQRQNFNFFTKVLTASDTSIHGGYSVLRKHAIECLPMLDMSQPTPSQELIAKDLFDHEWKFKHVFRGTPQRHLFTTGWNAFATTKKLVVGDAFVFIRGENGESRVGIRRAAKQQSKITSSIISIENIHHGVLASTYNAMHTNSVLVVFYRPRSSQFVVSYDKFVDAVNNKFNVGSRFTMRFENEDFNEIRYTGTIVEHKDFSPHWNVSEWRNLQVQWDEPASITRPDKVSAWEIESLTPSTNVPHSALLTNKRARQVFNLTGSTSSSMWTPTLIQGQEIGQSSMSSQVNATDGYDIPCGWPLSCLVPAMSKPNYIEQMVLPMKEKVFTDAATSCKLFGVDLMTNPTITKDLMGSIDSFQKSKIFEEEKLDQIQTLIKSPKEIQSKQINSTRNRTKVHMQGVAIGRAVDLTLLDGYNQLIEKLEQLFDLKGELQTRNQFEIVFTDNEGDMMLVGDDPWPEFCNMVKKIFICSKGEVQKIKPGNKLYEGESTM